MNLIIQIGVRKPIKGRITYLKTKAPRSLFLKKSQTHSKFLHLAILPKSGVFSTNNGYKCVEEIEGFHLMYNFA